MAKFRLFVFILLGILMVASCEKDDICVDGDTPLLQISFYDISDTDTQVEATSIRVIGEGQEDYVETDSLVDRTDLENISIPLKTTENSTTFIFILDSDDDDDGNETGNSDTITFTYELGDEYVSKACGYIANYNGLSATVTPDEDNWIKEVEIIAEDINLDNIYTTHVKIFL